MEKQRGMAFGFRKTATAVKNTGWIDNILKRSPPFKCAFYGSPLNIKRAVLAFHRAYIIIIIIIPDSYITEVPG